MVLDGLRGYLQLANGLTDVTRSRARSAAAALVAQGESHVGAVLPTPVRAQVASLTDDLVATSRTNRDLLVGLVRAEVERSVSRLGLVSTQELDVATRRAQLLEGRVAELEADLRSATATATASRASSPARRSAATRSDATTHPAAKKAPTKKLAAKKAATKKVATKRAATTQPATKKAPTKKAATKKAAAKEVATKKAATKKATTRKAATRKAAATNAATSGAASKKTAASQSRQSPAATT